jgi:hypothetical protein
MRRCAAGSLLLAALACPVAAFAEAPDPDAFCGDDSYFWVKDPAGWQRLPERERRSGDLAFSYGVRPPDGAPGADAVTLSIRVMGSRYEAPDADPRDILFGTLTLLTAGGAQFDGLQELRIAHPSLPSEGIRVVGASANVYVIAVAVPRGGGSHAVLTMLVKERVAKPAELDAMSSMLASFRYDPDHRCYPKGDVVEKLPMERRESSWPEPSEQKARAADTAARGFSLERALMGATIREKLFVPIGGGLVEIDGKPAVLIDYYGDQKGYGGNSLSEFLDGHARQIALPWCFETLRAPSAPPIVFRVEGKDGFQRFDCKAMRFSKTFRGEVRRPKPERAKPTPAAAEKSGSR